MRTIGIRLGSLLLFASFVALLAATTARADVDLSNDWLVDVDGVPAPLHCDLAFVQSAGGLTAGGSCRGLTSQATFTGSVDGQSGQFTLSGSIYVARPGFPFIYVSLVGAPTGDASVLAGSAVVDGSSGTFEARLCGNGNLDPGEACDDGATLDGCCTSSCTPRPDGVSCTATEQCQTAPTCASGVCTGSPKPAGTVCEADGNACTDDACDGAGACATGPCSPCCAGAQCVPAPGGGGCKGTTDAHNSIDIVATPSDVKNKIVWTVQHLDATSPQDLPDPQTTDYAVCLYTLSANDYFSVLAYDAVAPAGAGCGGDRCWTQKSTGVTYRGGTQRPGGVASLRVNTGADGKAKLSFVGRGPRLGLTDPLLIPGGELLAELHAGGSCWSVLYLNDGVKPSIRESDRYRAKGGQ